MPPDLGRGQDDRHRMRCQWLQADLREVEEQMAEQSNKLDLLGRRNATREQLTRLQAYTAGSRPIPRAKAIASAVAAMCTPASSWLIVLRACPSPGRTAVDLIWRGSGGRLLDGQVGLSVDRMQTAACLAPKLEWNIGEFSIFGGCCVISSSSRHLPSRSRRTAAHECLARIGPNRNRWASVHHQLDGCGRGAGPG